jgi:hypothetical protein
VSQFGGIAGVIELLVEITGFVLQVANNTLLSQELSRKKKQCN